MSEELEIKYIDRRTVARYIQRGQVNDKDFEKYLKSLPDVADKGENIVVEQPGTQTDAE